MFSLPIMVCTKVCYVLNRVMYLRNLSTLSGCWNTTHFQEEVVSYLISLPTNITMTLYHVISNSRYDVKMGRTCVAILTLITGKLHVRT